MKTNKDFFEKIDTNKNQNLSQSGNDKPIPFELDKNSLDEEIKCDDIKGAGKIRSVRS